jgi:hypothetical protein
MEPIGPVGSSNLTGRAKKIGTRMGPYFFAAEEIELGRPKG